MTRSEEVLVNLVNIVNIVNLLSPQLEQGYFSRFNSPR